MKLAIIGGGNMGYAFVVGLISKGIYKVDDILVVEPYNVRREFLTSQAGLQVTAEADQRLSKAETVLLAVKPQEFQNVALQIKSYLNANQLILSIMTGIRISEIRNQLVGPSQIVRSMPNLPVQIGRGFTVYLMSPEISTDRRKLINAIFSAVGSSTEVQDEKLLDAATALSASGSGFVYYILEHYISKSIALGFSAEQAKQMVLETFAGALELAKNSEYSLGELRSQVTSKGGTTEAGLKHFEQSDFGAILAEGLNKAYFRAVELSKI